MAVAHSAASESHAATTGSVSQTSFSWTHTQTGTPQGVLVFVHVANSAGNPVSSVTYGSVTLTRVSGGAAVDGVNEPGRTDLFFAGSGLGTGNQTVTVNRANTVDVMYASAATVTAATNTNVTGIVLLEGDGALTVQSVTDGGAPTNSLRYAAAYSGLAAPPPAGTGSTLLNSIDFGVYGIALVRETTAGTGARNVGFNNTNTDDRAAVHVAVRELWNRTDTQTVGAFTLTGNAATFTKASPKVITGETGSFTLTGEPVTLAEATPKAITADTGAFTLTGNPATVRRGYALGAETGAFTAAGQPATLRQNPRIEANTGSFVLSGGAPALLRGWYLSGGAGEFIETGQPATFRRTWAVQAATGAFAFTGNPAALTELGAYEIDPIVGGFTLAGQPANLAQSRTMPVDAGTFTFTGQPATLGQSPALAAEAGPFTTTGQSAALTQGYRLDGDTGAFAFTGNPATLTKQSAKQLAADSGALVVAGQPAALSAARGLAPDYGVLALTGQPVTLRHGRTLMVSACALDLIGSSVALTEGGALQLSADRGAFVLTAPAASLSKPGTGRRRNVLIF